MSDEAFGLFGLGVAAAAILLTAAAYCLNESLEARYWRRKDEELKKDIWEKMRTENYSQKLFGNRDQNDKER